MGTISNYLYEVSERLKCANNIDYHLEITKWKNGLHQDIINKAEEIYLSNKEKFINDKVALNVSIQNIGNIINDIKENPLDDAIAEYNFWSQVEFYLIYAI